MKQNKNVYRMMIIVMLTGFTMFGATIQAQPLQNPTRETESTLSVDYLGKENGYIVFKVTIPGQSIGKNILTIRNQDDLVLFKESIPAPGFAKRMLFYPEEVKTVTFSFDAAGKEIKKIFKVQYEITETLQVKEQDIK